MWDWTSLARLGLYHQTVYRHCKAAPAVPPVLLTMPYLHYKITSQGPWTGILSNQVCLYLKNSSSSHTAMNCLLPAIFSHQLLTKQFLPLFPGIHHSVFSKPNWLGAPPLYFHRENSRHIWSLLLNMSLRQLRRWTYQHMYAESSASWKYPNYCVSALASICSHVI